jgi:hypothetical protein
MTPNAKSPQNAPAIKARLRKALVAKKTGDLSSVRGRGKEVLSFVRGNAKTDLEYVEAFVFSKLDLTAFAAQLEDVMGAGADAS